VGDDRHVARALFAPLATALCGSRKQLRAALVCLAAAVLVGALPANAGDEEGGRDPAMLAANAVPLERLLEQIRLEFPGRILRVELEREWRDREPMWVYEAKVLTDQGNVLKLKYHAGSMKLLELSGRHEDPERHDDDD
jgi:hypothetical protein